MLQNLTLPEKLGIVLATYFTILTSPSILSSNSTVFLEEIQHRLYCLEQPQHREDTTLQKKIFCTTTLIQ